MTLTINTVVALFFLFGVAIASRSFTKTGYVVTGVVLIFIAFLFAVGLFHAAA